VGRRVSGQVRLRSVSIDDEDDELDEIPVGEFVVDVRHYEVRLPDGKSWAYDGDLGQGLISEESVRRLPLATVAAALGVLSERVGDGAPDGWFLETDPPDRLYDIEVHDGLALESYGSDELYVLVSIGLQVDFDDGFEAAMEEILAPMLRHAGAVGRRSRVSQVFEHQAIVMLRFESMVNRTAGDLIALGDDVRALLLAVRSGEANEKVALNLALAGHAAALLGQPESRWLEAKKQPWTLGTPAGNAEAAKDISAMANAQGGMILIPARTTLVSGREVISDVGDLPVELINVSQIRDVLNQRVFPPLPDLITEVVPTTSGRGRLIVAVGAHRPDNWPHPVIGEPTSDFPVQAISAWVRDGDRNRALTAPELHALLRPRPDRAP
jgi:hypothetical protein